MRRRTSLSIVVFLLLVAALGFPKTETRSGAPPLNVAFVISEGFTLIDLAGPWEVFGAARTPVPEVAFPPEPRLFNMYTVSATSSPVSMGLSSTKMTPDYTFENAPKPDIIVVGAQDWRKEVPGLDAWLKKENSDNITIMSVCIGANYLADAGLLDGKVATTHHAFIKDFRKDYPKTSWLEGKRFVKSSDTVWTSGGLMSGIDLALRVVADRFGQSTAQFTADWLEYTGTGWK